MDVQEWRAGLPISPSRKRKASNVLSLVLDAAVLAKLIPSNPAKGQRLPKVDRAEMCFLTPEQVELLADVIDRRYRVLVFYLAYTGKRTSEVTALRVRRLDLEVGSARVEEKAVEVGGKLKWGPPKNHEKRTVRLPQFLIDMLREHVNGKAPNDLVFTAARGGPLRENNFRTRYFDPAVKAAGLPVELRVHDLRHTCASLLIRLGASVKAIQKQLGHKSAKVTLDTYGHLWPDELDELAVKMEEARKGALNGEGR